VHFGNGPQLHLTKPWNAMGHSIGNGVALWLCLIHSFALSETMTVCIDDSTRSIAINIFIAACQY